MNRNQDEVLFYHPDAVSLDGFKTPGSLTGNMADLYCPVELQDVEHR